MRMCFFYFDPPYRPISKTSSFTSYSKDSFNDKDQEALADFCKELDSKGWKFIASNSDGFSVNPNDTFIMDLYHTFNIEHIMASRCINSKGDGRNKVSELLIHNYNDVKGEQ